MQQRRSRAVLPTVLVVMATLVAAAPASRAESPVAVDNGPRAPLIGAGFEDPASVLAQLLGGSLLVLPAGTDEVVDVLDSIGVGGVVFFVHPIPVSRRPATQPHRISAGPLPLVCAGHGNTPPCLTFC